MSVITQKHVRKPLFVDAVRVTAENFLEISLWCNGTIRNKEGETVDDRPVDPRKDHIYLEAHNPKNERQQKAYVGDYVLKTDKGFKIYTKRAFDNSFDAVVPEPTKRLAHPSDPAAKMDRPNIHTEPDIDLRAEVDRQIKEAPMGIDGLSNIQGDGPSSDPQVHTGDAIDPAVEQVTTEEATPEGIRDAIEETEAAKQKSLEQAGEQAEAEKEAAKPPELQDDPGVPGDQPTEGSWGGGEEQIES